MNSNFVFLVLLLSFAVVTFSYPSNGNDDDDSEQDPPCVPRADLKNFADTYEGKRIYGASGLRCTDWHNSAYFPIDDDEDYPFYTISHSYCRGFHFNDNAMYGPWCFLEYNEAVTKAIQWEPCFTACEDANRTCVRYHETPMDRNYYLANKSKSADDRNCRAWNSVYNTGELSTWKHNYCRAVPADLNLPHASKAKVPWCHVDSDPNKQIPCFYNCHDIANCTEKTEVTLPYSGNRQQSVNGRRCDLWITHPLRGRYPMATANDKNYCRNFGALATGPFCLIKEDKLKGDGVSIEPCFEHCDDTKGAYCVGAEKLKDYWGGKHVTLSGKTCRRWDALNGSVPAQDLGVAELWEASNFCRNPDSSLEGPWCYLTPTTRESCFSMCAGRDDRMSSTSADTVTITAHDELPEGRSGLHVVLIAFLFVVGVLLVCLLGDLCCRKAAYNRLKVDKSLEEARENIELFRPGHNDRPLTKEYVDKWTKLVDAYNALKKRKEYAVGEVV